MSRNVVPRCLLLAFLLTAVQLGFALIISPDYLEGSDRYRSLIQHDSYWFSNIVERGYQSTLPPSPQKLMEVSNVAFFPAYPLLAKALHLATNLGAHNSLLLVSQLAAVGFWAYILLLCERWEISRWPRFFGVLAIFAHPTAYFLVVGYSESLFMMGLVGFIFWSGAKGRLSGWIAAAHGGVMSATRIVGLLCALYPLVQTAARHGWRGVTQPREWLRRYKTAALVAAGGMLGGVGFLVFCQVRFGAWNLYMLTQEAGWAVNPDYLAVFRPESYRWALPPPNDPTRMSQFAMALGALLFVLAGLIEIIAALRRETQWRERVALYFCAFVTYYLAVSGVASVQMESMLRYQFCSYALIILAFLHFLRQHPRPPSLVRAGGMAAIALLSAAGLGLQVWFLWNFTRGNWIA